MSIVRQHIGPDEKDTSKRTNQRELSGMVTEEKTTIPGLDQFLKSKGYELLKEIGDKEGNTRDVFLASYSSGNFKELRVVKIPKEVDTSKSFYLMVNTSRRNIHEHEAQMAGQINSPHVAKALDHIPYDSENGKKLDIMVEEYFNAQSLKSLVKKAGPLTNKDKIHNIFSQVAKGLKDLHKKEFVHRDIKASNILVNDDMLVKITDLQNSGNRSSIEDTLLPTRGDSSHTSPSLLNAVMSNIRDSASYTNDIYAFGATLYETVTGKIPLDYKLAIGGVNKFVSVNEIKYPVHILVDGEPIDVIDGKSHEKRLKKALKKSPKSVRGIIYKCMTSEYKHRYPSTEELLHDIDKLQRPDGTKWLNRIYDSMKFGLGTAAGVFAGLGILYFGITSPKTPPLSQAELINKRRIIEYNMENRFDNSYMWSVLKDNADNAQKKIEALSEEQTSTIETMVRFGESTHGISKRSGYALLRAIAIANQEDLTHAYGESRVLPYCVPKNFHPDKLMHAFERTQDIHTNYNAAIMYFCSNARWSDNVAENFAAYFIDKNDITNAMIGSKGYNYFPEADSTGAIKPGYYTHIFSVQKKLVEDATVLYLLSDENGNLDWNKMPTMVRTTGNTEDSQYRIFKTHSDSATVNQ